MEENKNSKIEVEASVFWSKIAEYLPKSFERSALGDEKIYNAFYPAYLQFREVLLHTLQEEYKKDMRYNPMGVGEMLERWGKSLQNNPPI